MGRDPVEEERRGGKRRRPRKSTGTVDWESIDGNILIRAIASVALAGGALRFGYSRDGGAYAVGVYGDGSPYTEFEHSAADIEILLTDLSEWFADNGANEDSPPPRKKATKSA